MTHIAIANCPVPSTSSLLSQPQTPIQPENNVASAVLLQPARCLAIQHFVLFATRQEKASPPIVDCSCPKA